MNNDRSAVIVLVLRCFLGFALFLPLGIDKIAAFPGSSAGIVESHRETILGIAPSLPLPLESVTSASNFRCATSSPMAVRDTSSKSHS